MVSGVGVRRGLTAHSLLVSAGIGVPERHIPGPGAGGGGAQEAGLCEGETHSCCRKLQALLGVQSYTGFDSLNNTRTWMSLSPFLKQGDGHREAFQVHWAFRGPTHCCRFQTPPVVLLFF